MRAAWFALLTGVAASACGARHRAPQPEDVKQTMPDLTGRGVMLLPAQGGATTRPPERLDDEIRYWIGQQAPNVKWVFPPQLLRAIRRSPPLGDIDLDALPVASFRAAQVKRIGDPLFGDLRRLGAVVDARYALLPVTAAYVPGDTLPGRVEIASALIDTFGGEVLWYGVVAGERGPADDERVVASAARALASKVAR